MDILTLGNTAKLYCLNWIESYLKTQTAPISILDLGCGSGSNFAALLKRYPQVAYVGVEPSAEGIGQAHRTLAGLNVTLIQDYAYDAVRAKLPQLHYDVVVSFSVFEHVYQRLDYLRMVQACLKPTGYALINYDSGHFHSTYWRERVKNIVGPLLATFGNQGYYQAFVREADFRRMAQEAGLQIAEAKSFNTHLKGVYKHIPDAQRPAFMQHWLEIETWMNDVAVPYDDSKASTWHTRNFILQKTK